MKRLLTLTIIGALALSASASAGWHQRSGDTAIHPFSLVAARQAATMMEFRFWNRDGTTATVSPQRCSARALMTYCVDMAPRACWWLSSTRAQCRTDNTAVFFAINGQPVVSTIRFYDDVTRQDARLVARASA